MVSSTVGHVNQAELIIELDRKLILLPSVINVCLHCGDEPILWIAFVCRTPDECRPMWCVIGWSGNPLSPLSKRVLNLNCESDWFTPKFSYLFLNGP